MQRFAGRLTVDQVTVAAKLTVAAGRVSVEVDGWGVGDWAVADLRVEREAERFRFTTPEGEVFTFTTVWDDDLQAALHPPSSFAAELAGRFSP